MEKLLLRVNLTDGSCKEEQIPPEVLRNFIGGKGLAAYYAYKELKYCEALGLCGDGEAGRLIDDGITELGGSLPVNPSGGLLGEGNAVGTSGLIRAANAAYQIRGEAGGFQVPNVDVAVAQGWGGMPTYCGGVVVMSRW